MQLTEAVCTSLAKGNNMPERPEVDETWPTKEEIRHHAYELFVARRDDEPGSDLNDWLAAEAQLKAAGRGAARLGKS
jgi:hypothetical protein